MNTSNPSALKGNLKSLVATGGVLVGAGTAGQAAIVYTDLATDLTVSSGSSIYFSLAAGAADTTGTVVGQFRLLFEFGPPTPRLLRWADNGSVAGSGAPNYALRLATDTPINSGLSFSANANLAYYGAGPWDPGNRGYLGLSFNAGAGDRFGWADVSYNADSSVTLYGFAYEDSGGQILAGATPVPEPAATGALAALFAGSLAAFEARRRRKTARQAERIAV